MKKALESLVSLKDSDFRLIAIASLISGVGSALIPIAFAIETIRIEPKGWGMACVLIALWVGRFIGIFMYKRFGFKLHPLVIMIWSSLVMGLAQLGLILWMYFFENSILAMSVSSFSYRLPQHFLCHHNLYVFL